MSDTIIEVRNVSKSFGARRALDLVSLHVDSGQIVGLLGPNGGGKTTLFRILATILRPDEGEVRICGQAPGNGSVEIRRLIGVVFQSPSLDKKLTAAENLRHHGYLYGLRGADLDRRIEVLLQRLDIADRSSDLIETLSGGLARRVEIAKGLLHGPRVLLLDEPGTGLDPAVRRELWQHLDTLRREGDVAVLMTTHILEEAERCDRVAILDRGRIVAEGPPSRLIAEVGGDVINIETDECQAVARRIEGELSLPVSVVGRRVHIETANGAEWIPKLAGVLREDVISITLSRPSLEDAFIHLTGRQFDSETD